MLTRLKLLQSKYNLSNEFMSKAIRSEIERQALIDIRGIVNNGSIALLEDIISDFTHITPPVILDDYVATINTPVIKPKAKRRG